MASERGRVHSDELSRLAEHSSHARAGKAGAVLFYTTLLY